MKHLRLFFAAIAAMVGLNASAQLENGTVYWIQDTATGQFLSQGANWGTQATVQDVGGLGFEAAYVSDGVYRLKNIMWNKVNNADLGLRATDGYCDQPASDLTLTPSGNGYLVGIAGGNYLCNNQSENAYGVKPIGFTANAEDATVWKFLTKSEYDNAIKAYKDSKATSFATTLGYTTTSVSALEDIINNEDQFVSKDLTNSITNAALNTGNTNGWTATKPNQRDQAFGSENGTCAESWNGCVVATQQVSGLPIGLYKVTFVGTFRPKGSAESERLTSEQTSSPAYVFANDAKEEFIHWIDVSAKANNRSAVVSNKEAYTSTFYTYVTDGKLNLGVKQDTWYNGSMWCPFGYFTLTYYTDKVSDEDITALEATIPTTIPTALQESLNSLKTSLETAKTIASYNALAKAIEDAKKVETVYSNYLVAKDNVLALKSQTTFTDEGGAAAAQLDADVATADAAAKAATTVEAINAAIKQVRTAAGTFAGAVKINNGEYLDLTDAMLFNAAMREEGGLSLWNIISNTNAAYPMYNGRCSEFWNANFEFNQTACNLPAGNYNIEVYAFHRAGNYNTYLYANNDNIQVLPIANGENSMTDAANAFDQGLYLNSLKITLEEAQDVVIGFKNEDTETDKWTIFRDFKIKFFGDDALAVFRDEYESALAEAEAALTNEDYSNVTGEEKTALNTAVTETYPKTVVEVDETQGKFETATAALKEATTTFKSSKAAYDKFAAAKAAAADNKVDYPYASADKLAAYQANLTDATTATEASTKADAIVTSYRTYVESNALAEGVEGATDLTSKIKQDAIADWTAEITGSNAKFVLKNADGNDDDTYTAADGTKGKNLIDSGDLWGASSWTAKMTQTITLNAGKYVLTAAARGSNDLSTFKLLVDDKSVDLGHTGGAVGNGVFDCGFNDYYVEFEVTDYSNEVTIGFEAATKAEHNWCTVARFRLAQIEDKVEWATEEELNAYINALQANTLGFEEGEYAPYVNAESIQALQNISSAVDAVFASSFDGNHVPKQTLESAIEEINALEWTANTEEVNAFFDGAFASEYSHEGNVMPIGWHAGDGVSDNATNMRLMWNYESNAGLNATSSKQGAFAKFTALYGTEPGYTLPLKAGVYILEFIYGGWNEKAVRDIRIYNDDNQATITPASITAKDNKAHTTVDSWSEYKGVVSIPSDGDYIFSFYRENTKSQNQLVFSDISLFKAKPEIVTIKNGFTGTTYSSAYPLDFSAAEGLTAYIITDVENGKCVTQEVTKVPAGTGVYVEGDAAEYSVNIYGGTQFDSVEGNLLVGTGAESATLLSDATNTYYMYGKQNGKESFFKVGTETSRTASAHKAYLAIKSSNENAAKSMLFVGEGVATGINAVENANVVNGEVYNLNGQRVNNAQKGVYIVNGKKMVLK